MTTHYILADDYDRWNPGEPIEDVASDIEYIQEMWFYSESPLGLHEWIDENTIRIETDENGNILS